MIDCFTEIRARTFGHAAGKPELITAVNTSRRIIGRPLAPTLGREPIIEEVDRGARRGDRVGHHVIGCGRRRGIAEAEQRRKIVQRVRNRRLRHDGRRERHARERRSHQMGLSPRAMRAVARSPLPPYPEHAVPPNYVVHRAASALFYATSNMD